MSLSASNSGGTSILTDLTELTTLSSESPRRFVDSASSHPLAGANASSASASPHAPDAFGSSTSAAFTTNRLLAASKAAVTATTTTTKVPSGVLPKPLTTTPLHPHKVGGRGSNGNAPSESPAGTSLDAIFESLGVFDLPDLEDGGTPSSTKGLICPTGNGALLAPTPVGKTISAEKQEYILHTPKLGGGGTNVGRGIGATVTAGGGPRPYAASAGNAPSAASKGQRAVLPQPPSAMAKASTPQATSLTTTASIIAATVANGKGVKDTNGWVSEGTSVVNVVVKKAIPAAPQQSPTVAIAGSAATPPPAAKAKEPTTTASVGAAVSNATMLSVKGLDTTDLGMGASFARGRCGSSASKLGLNATWMDDLASFVSAFNDPTVSGKVSPQALAKLKGMLSPAPTPSKTTGRGVKADINGNDDDNGDVSDFTISNSMTPSKSPMPFFLQPSPPGGSVSQYSQQSASRAGGEGAVGIGAAEASTVASRSANVLLQRHDTVPFNMSNSDNSAGGAAVTTPLIRLTAPDSDGAPLVEFVPIEAFDVSGGSEAASPLARAPPNATAADSSRRSRSQSIFLGFSPTAASPADSNRRRRASSVSFLAEAPARRRSSVGNALSLGASGGNTTATGAEADTGDNGGPETEHTVIVRPKTPPFNPTRGTDDGNKAPADAATLAGGGSGNNNTVMSPTYNATMLSCWSPTVGADSIVGGAASPPPRRRRASSVSFLGEAPHRRQSVSVTYAFPTEGAEADTAKDEEAMKPEGSLNNSGNTNSNPTLIRRASMTEHTVVVRPKTPPMVAATPSEAGADGGKDGKADAVVPRTPIRASFTGFRRSVSMPTGEDSNPKQPHAPTSPNPHHNYNHHHYPDSNTTKAGRGPSEAIVVVAPIKVTDADAEDLQRAFVDRYPTLTVPASLVKWFVEAGAGGGGVGGGNDGRAGSSIGAKEGTPDPFTNSQHMLVNATRAAEVNCKRLSAARLSAAGCGASNSSVDGINTGLMPPNPALNTKRQRLDRLLSITEVTGGSGGGGRTGMMGSDPLSLPPLLLSASVNSTADDMIRRVSGDTNNGSTSQPQSSRRSTRRGTSVSFVGEQQPGDGQHHHHYADVFPIAGVFDDERSPDRCPTTARSSNASSTAVSRRPSLLLPKTVHHFGEGGVGVKRRSILSPTISFAGDDVPKRAQSPSESAGGGGGGVTTTNGATYSDSQNSGGSNTSSDADANGHAMEGGALNLASPKTPHPPASQGGGDTSAQPRFGRRASNKAGEDGPSVATSATASKSAPVSRTASTLGSGAIRTTQSTLKPSNAQQQHQLIATAPKEGADLSAAFPTPNANKPLTSSALSACPPAGRRRSSTFANGATRPSPIDTKAEAKEGDGSLGELNLPLRPPTPPADTLHDRRRSSLSGAAGFAFARRSLPSLFPPTEHEPTANSTAFTESAHKHDHSTTLVFFQGQHMTQGEKEARLQQSRRRSEHFKQLALDYLATAGSNGSLDGMF